MAVRRCIGQLCIRPPGLSCELGAGELGEPARSHSLYLSLRESVGLGERPPTVALWLGKLTRETILWPPSGVIRPVPAQRMYMSPA